MVVSCNGVDAGNTTVVAAVFVAADEYALCVIAIHVYIYIYIICIYMYIHIHSYIHTYIHTYKVYTYITPSFIHALATFVYGSVKKDSRVCNLRESARFYTHAALNLDAIKSIDLVWKDEHSCKRCGVI
jgi:hypothetical protein